MISRISVRVLRSVYSQAINLYFYTKSDNPDKVRVMKNAIFEEVDRGAFLPDESVKLEIDEAQELMDELWSCGVRPTEGAGTSGAMGAAQSHIKDLQETVGRLFGLLERK